MTPVWSAVTVSLSYFSFRTAFMTSHYHHTSTRSSLIPDRPISGADVASAVFCDTRYNSYQYFTLSQSGLCGHSYKLHKPSSKLDIRKFSFSVCVINIRNALRYSVLQCNTVSTFKRHLNLYLKQESRWKWDICMLWLFFPLHRSAGFNATRTTSDTIYVALNADRTTFTCSRCASVLHFTTMQTELPG